MSSRVASCLRSPRFCANTHRTQVEAGGPDDRGALRSVAIEQPPPPITPEAIDALIRFLPVFESPDFSPGEWHESWTDDAGVIHMGWFELSGEAQAFVTELGRHGWVFVFDWSAWSEEAHRLIETDGVERADVDTLRRLLTLLVRRDRFYEGQLEWAMQSGLVTRILRRLQVLSRS